MKYLKGFNEKKTDDVEIYNLSKDYLTYLFDEDFSCQVYKTYEWHGEIVCVIRLTKYKNKYNGIITNFDWNECKHEFIAFIHLLSKDYNVDYISFDNDKRTLQQLLNNEDCDFKSIRSVTAVLSDK